MKSSNVTMIFTRLLLVITFAISLCRTFSAKNEVVIPDLRPSHNYGPFGRFLMDRRIVKEKVEELSGQGMELELPSATEYNTELYGEVSIFIQHFRDLTLPVQLDPELRDQVSTDARYLMIGIPVVSNGDHTAVIMLRCFTDRKKPVIEPHMTNYKAARQIDSIEMDDGDLVTIRDGNDVMVFRVNHDKDCINNKTVGHDIDDITGKDIRMTNYPMPFDWGCDLIGGEVNFCLALDPYMNDIMSADGNVCTSMSTSRSRRCSAEMELLEMTGVFRESAPHVASLVPIKAFEAEWIERDHSLGVVYPCL